MLLILLYNNVPVNRFCETFYFDNTKYSIREQSHEKTYTINTRRVKQHS